MGEWVMRKRVTWMERLVPLLTRGALVRLLTRAVPSLALVACSGGDGTSGASGTGGAGPFVPAAHPPLPEVQDLGGPVVQKPRILPIAYASDEGLSYLEGFLTDLTKTTYWSDVTSEYGVGPLTILPTVEIGTPPPAKIDDTDLQAMITANTTGASPAWGPADAGTIYLFLMPKGTVVTRGGAASCQAFDGYHLSVDAGATRVPYAVSCTCDDQFYGPSITELEERTLNTGHELIEAATDPLLGHDDAYAGEDHAHVAWYIVTGGELADMCEQDDDAFFTPQGSKYMVPRSWSNARAKKGENPCVPRDPSTVYFNSVPDLGTVTWTEAGHGDVQTEGVQIPVGKTKTIDLHLFSTAPMPGPWTVKAYDYDAFFYGGTPKLGLTLDESKGENGDTLHLTIEVMGQDAQLGAEAFILLSDHGKPTDADFQSNLSVGLVVN